MIARNATSINSTYIIRATCHPGFAKEVVGSLENPYPLTLPRQKLKAASQLNKPDLNLDRRPHQENVINAQMATSGGHAILIPRFAREEIVLAKSLTKQTQPLELMHLV
jgi:hypothetical protein